MEIWSIFDMALLVLQIVGKVPFHEIFYNRFELNILVHSIKFENEWKSGTFLTHFTFLL